MNKMGAKLVKAEIMGNTVRSICLYQNLHNLTGTLKYENAVQYNCSDFKQILSGFPSIFYIFQAMIEKLKSQLEAARKAKENHAVQMKQRETAKSKQVWDYLSCFVNVI